MTPEVIVNMVKGDDGYKILQETLKAGLYTLKIRASDDKRYMLKTYWDSHYIVISRRSGRQYVQIKVFWRPCDFKGRPKRTGLYTLFDTFKKRICSVKENKELETNFQGKLICTEISP